MNPAKLEPSGVVIGLSKYFATIRHSALFHTTIEMRRRRGTTVEASLEHGQEMERMFL